MATIRQTAQILQFPVRPRSDAAETGMDARLAEVSALRLPKVVVTGAWYHEAALAEEQAPSRH